MGMLSWLMNLGFAGGDAGGGLTSVSKRGSAIQFDTAWFMTGPIPDGTIDQGDRQHVSMKYSGILAGAPPTPPTTTEVLLSMTHRGLGWGMASGIG